MNKNIIFISILILAFLIRFIGLEKLSPPLNRDEAGIGYNAYSLIKTGKDEHAMVLPLSFKSIGDYKMPGYIYLSMLPIKLFGLNVFTTRFWSALSGFLAVLLLYFLSQELAQYFKLPKKQIERISLFSAFVFSINPWHIHYSRIAFEANVNLTLFLAAILFLFKSFKKPKYIFLSILFFLVMQLMYSSTFIFLPIFLLTTFLIFFNNLLKINKSVLISNLLIFILLSFLITKSVFSVSGAKSSITYFSDPTTIDNFNRIRGEWNQKNPIIGKLFFNKPIYIFVKIIPNYIKTFLPGFLFFNQVNHPWHFIPNQGYFYFIDGLLFLFGIIYLVKQKNKTSAFLFLWLLISPAASVITIDAPHATRSLFLIPIFIIISSFGFFYLFNLLNFKKQFYLLIAIFYLLSFFYFAYSYFFQFPKKYAKSLFPEIQKPISYIQKQNENREIYYTNVSDSPYLYILFYERIDPDYVHQNAKWKGQDTAGLTHIEKIGKYNFVEGIPEIIIPAYLVLQGENLAPANFKLEKEFVNKYNEISWQIYKN